MDLSRTFKIDKAPPTLFQRLDGRDVAIWITDQFVRDADAGLTSALLRLPWRVVLCESANAALLAALEEAESSEDPLVQRRGFVQLIDVNPSDIPLPTRALPVYLLNGRNATKALGLAGLTRRLTMLDGLRRMQPRELVIAAGSADALPTELSSLWDEGFRTELTVVSDSAEMASTVEAWRTQRPFGTTATLLQESATTFCETFTIAGRSHWEFTRDGKMLLHEYIKEHATLNDLNGVVQLIRALRDYLFMKADHIKC
jgi:hypothetical protein